MSNFSYLELLLFSGCLPISLLLITKKHFLNKYRKIFLKTAIGSLIFAFPWYSLAIGNRIWYFLKPLIGFEIFYVPLEEILFILMLTFLLTFVTLLFLENAKP